MMAGQTKGGGKPAGFSIFGRSPVLEDEEEVAVMLPPASAAPAARKAGQVGIDLSGTPKLWFVIGPGRSGKTTLLRYVAETILAAGEGHEAMFVAMDPGNRSLTGFLDGVLQPPTSDATANAKWLEQLIEHTMDNKVSALIDLGGGDTSLGKLLAQVPDLVARLEEAAIAPVAIYTIGPRQDDLTALGGMEAAGFQPKATAIVCNEGLADPTTPRAEAFARILRHSVYRAAVARGAVPLWMPMLDPGVAADIEAKRLHFTDARDAVVPEGRKVAPLGTFDRSRIRQWLEAMNAEFGAIRSWLP
jgi:hypothetical protein